MINHDGTYRGMALMHRKTKRWYLVIAKSMQGILVSSIDEPVTPTPLMVILVRDFRDWMFEAKVKETAIEKEVREAREMEELSQS